MDIKIQKKINKQFEIKKKNRFFKVKVVKY